MSMELMDGTVECGACNPLMNNSKGDLRNSEKAVSLWVGVDLNKWIDKMGCSEDTNIVLVLSY